MASCLINFIYRPVGRQILHRAKDASVFSMSADLYREYGAKVATDLWNEEFNYHNSVLTTHQHTYK